MNWTFLEHIGQLLAPWVTIAGVIVIFIAYRTYNQNNYIQRWNLIQNLYTDFLKPDHYKFYKRIKKGENIDFIASTENEKLLNDALTLFDAIHYLQTQNLLNKKAWEYVACELHNFNRNDSVHEYMEMVKNEYIKKGFPEDIIPFTGFPDLVKNIPCEFRRTGQHCRFIFYKKSHCICVVAKFTAFVKHILFYQIEDLFLKKN